MDNESNKIWNIYEEIDTTVQHNRTYPEIPKSPKPKGTSTMQLDDFLQRNKENSTTSELVNKYFEQVSKILQGNNNTLKVNVLLALYSFAELSGYREGLAEGRNIVHDSTKFMDD